MNQYDKLLNDLAPKKFGKLGVIWTSLLVVITIAGIIAYIDQIIKGQIVTNMRDYALWGVYISSFVFFVATSFVSSVAVAVLRLTNNKWRTPIVRIAEIISLASICMAGLTIVIDMARPDRILNTMIYGRLQSPITWDVIIIPTSIAVSFLLLFFPLLPDLAILKNKYKKENKPFLSMIYGKLALNYTGTPKQQEIVKKSIKIVALMIIPIGLILQTVDAWLFSTTYRIGWDSTNLAPYFIAGAFVAGLGALILGVAVIRKAYNLEEYITEFHFDKMGKFLALACLTYLYFNINEYMIPAYTATKGEAIHLEVLFTGHYAPLFWFVTVGGLIVPIIVMLFKKGRKPGPMLAIGILVVVTSWWKRYLIVTPTLLHPFLPIQGVPESWHHYFPSMHEWIISAATLAMAMLIITILVRYLPIIPIARTAEEKGIKITDKNDTDEN